MTRDAAPPRPAERAAVSERSISTLDQLAELPNDEVLEGYRDGLDGEPEPGNNRSVAYWHGWRNGAADSKRREKDDEQAELARLYVAATRLPAA